MAEGGGLTLKALAKHRLLDEVLRGAANPSGGWRVLLVDDVTVKVFSAALKLSDVTDAEVSLVEDLYKRREPMPSLEAIYFLFPCERSVRQLIEDFAGPTRMYKTAHVFFSSQLDKRLLNAVKASEALMDRLGTLKEVHLEFLTFDSRVFVCPLQDDLNALYSAGCQDAPGYEAGLEDVVRRLATLFASLNESPSVRFRAPPRAGPAPDESAGFRDALAGRLAGQLSQRLTGLGARLPDFPAHETCDLLILDRGFDPVAPLVHDWSYEHLCHDALRMRGSLWRYRYTTNGGKSEEREVALDEGDPLFRELRGLHLADVLLKLSDKAAAFGSSNNARGKGADVSVSALKKMVESLPQYREQLQKLTVHSTAAEEINAAIRARRLNDIGRLEQELVFGDATSKDLLRLLEALRPAGPPSSPASVGRGTALIAGEATASDRLRLLMCYFGTHAEKLDGAAALSKWKAAAALAADDMGAILNLELLGCAVLKRPPGAPKLKRVRRKAPPNDEGWDLPTFAPVAGDLVASLARGDLSQEAYPFVNPPVEAGAAARAAGAAVPGRSVRSSASAAAGGSGAGTARSARSAGATWAKKGGGGGGPESGGGGGLGGGLAELRLAQPRGRRLVVFVLGPVSFNEVRVAHDLAHSLGRDVFLGGTSVASSEEFLTKLRGLARREPGLAE